MKTRPIILIALFTCLHLYSYSQQIISAKFGIADRKKGLRGLELTLDSNLTVHINAAGTISYVDDGNTADQAFETSFEDYNQQEQVHKAGRYKVTYYTSFDSGEPLGKVKSIGSLQFRYYNRYDIHDEFGLLKSIGDLQLTYYNVFDIHDPKGQLKTAGKAAVTYFNKFDSEKQFGKIKSISGNTKNVSITKSRV